MRSLGVLIALLLIASQGVAHAAPAYSPYRTVHADMIFVTPYMTHVQTDLGYSTPAPGQEYLVVWLQARNGNDVPLYIGSHDFHIVGSDGSVGDAEYQTPEPVFGATLIPDAATKGTITFQVPLHSHSAVLRWAPTANNYDIHWPEFSWSLRF